MRVSDARSSSSLLTDAKKLAESGFDLPCGLFGLYYEEEDEEYEQLRAGKIAEKFELDVEYWYGLGIETVAVESFEGLRHPHHQHGAVVPPTVTRQPPDVRRAARGIASRAAGRPRGSSRSRIGYRTAAGAESRGVFPPQERREPRERVG